MYPIKQKPGLRPGTGIDMTKRLGGGVVASLTVEQLEERVQQYEARLQDQEARLMQVAQRQQVGGPSARPVPSPIGPSQLVAVSDAPIAFSPLDRTARQSVDLPFSASPGGGSTTSFLDPHLLPPDDIVRDLIGLYFTHLAPWAPIIPPQNFTPPWNIIVHAIVVVTLRLSSDPRIAGTKQQFHQAAKSHVISHAIESTSISSVQALALLALDLIGSEQGPSSWGILALLTRSAVHLGLIQEDAGLGRTQTPAPSLSRTSIIPPPQSWTEDESRRRLFWIIFCLDRYACASTGWDFALPDFEIKRRLPCSDELWAQNVSGRSLLTPGLVCHPVLQVGAPSRSRARQVHPQPDGVPRRSARSPRARALAASADSGAE